MCCCTNCICGTDMFASVVRALGMVFLFRMIEISLFDGAIRTRSYVLYKLYE